MTVDTVSLEPETATVPLAAPPSVARRKIVLCGFFGRGNAGDEAFLHAQYRLLSREFDVVVAVDKNAVREECLAWEPYVGAEIWTYDEFGRVFHDPIVHGVHVGGGSLPFGFASQFTMTALDRGKAVVLSGVDAALSRRAPGYEFRRNIYGRMNLVADRNERHFRTLKGLDNVMLGADWAVGLPVEPQGEPCDVLLTIRESSEIREDHLVAYRGVIDHLERQGRQVRYLPFSPEDDRLLDHLDIPRRLREVHWHDPRTVVGRIARANLVISMGRLHALIFSLLAGTPVLSIDPGIYRNGILTRNNKNRVAAETFRLRHFESSRDFLDSPPDLSKIEAEASGLTEEYRRRFADMADRVVGEFLDHRVPELLPRDIPVGEAQKYWAKEFSWRPAQLAAGMKPARSAPHAREGGVAHEKSD